MWMTRGLGTNTFYRNFLFEICRTLEKREIHAKFAAGEKVTQVLL
jgi:hypothetical protein